MSSGSDGIACANTNSRVVSPALTNEISSVLPSTSPLSKVTVYLHASISATRSKVESFVGTSPPFWALINCEIAVLNSTLLPLQLHAV